MPAEIVGLHAKILNTLKDGALTPTDISLNSGFELSRVRGMLETMYVRRLVNRREVPPGSIHYIWSLADIPEGLTTRNTGPRLP